ncbi:site-specific integrase [Haloarculaceae archaeon H-GB2-1]|nr:site-specific integrase [Haloarculaceae archaeon H-GB2-1]
MKQLVGYLERIEAVSDGLEDRVPVPTISAEDSRCEIKLAAKDAGKLIQKFRNSMAIYATVEHALLEVLWFTGARLSGVRALDLSDYNSEIGVLRFVNRPDEGTRLKNGDDGERPVAIPETVTQVLDDYIKRERFDRRDRFGRASLFSARQARPSTSSFRAYTYLGTQPCIFQSCPHGRDRNRCDYRFRNAASKCPSSRSPHQIRTGSITWQLNCGLSIEDVADRVNATPTVIRRHYDVATVDEKMRERRQNFIDNLSLAEVDE